MNLLENVHYNVNRGKKNTLNICTYVYIYYASDS